MKEVKKMFLLIFLPLVGCVFLPQFTKHVNSTNSSRTEISSSNFFSINSSDLGSFQFHFNNSRKKSSGFTTFQKWIKDFDSDFENITEARKSFYQETFDQNLKFIAESSKLNLTFSLGVNAFTHLTSEEFVTKYCGSIAPETYKVQPQPSNLITNRKIIMKNKWNNYTIKNLPKEFDWRKKVQPVIHQKTCGSCWAFAALAMIGKKRKIL